MGAISMFGYLVVSIVLGIVDGRNPIDARNLAQRQNSQSLMFLRPIK